MAGRRRAIDGPKTVGVAVGGLPRAPSRQARETELRQTKCRLTASAASSGAGEPGFPRVE